MTWRSTTAAAELGNQFESHVAPAEELEAARRFAARLRVPPEVVSLECSEPHHFALAFFRLLEQGATPLLGASPDEHPNRSRVDETGFHAGQGLADLAAEPGHFYAYSSGTSGRRKPLLFSLLRAQANARAHANSLGIGPQHVVAQTLPLHHSFGVVAYLLTPLVSGARVRLGVFFDAFVKGRQADNTVLHLTPNHLQWLARRRLAWASRPAVLSIGAGPLRRLEADYALQQTDSLWTTYGLSEMGPRVTTGRVEKDRFVDGWIGSPLPGIEHRLENDHLWVRSPYAARGFEDRWFDTGDRLSLTPDGSYVFHDRAHDVLRIRGQTCSRGPYCARLEEALGVSALVAQRACSDDLLVFLEGHPDRRVERALRSHFPELREAAVFWVPVLARTALGKPNVQAMFASLEPSS